MKTPAPVYLIDASVYVLRSYFALPDRWFDPRARSLNAFYGFSRWLLRVLAEQRPQQMALAFDESLQTCFRRQLVHSYKAHRAPADSALRYQFACCRQLCQILGLPHYASRYFEADDILATLAREAQNHGLPIVVASADKDLLSLMRGRDDRFWDIGRSERLTAAAIERRDGIRVDQYLDFLALVGDCADGVAGVPGVGAKTARLLLSRFDSLDRLFGQLDQLDRLLGSRGGRIRANLLASCDSLMLNRELMRLYDRVPLPDEPHWCEPAQGSRAALEGYLDSLNMREPLALALAAYYREPL